MTMLSKRRSFYLALSVLFLDTMGLSIVYPIFTPLVLKPADHFLALEDPFSLRLIYLVLLIASFPLMQFFGAPVLGHLSDKKGRKFGFTVSLIGEIVGFALSGLGLWIKNYPLVLFSRFLSGFFAANFTICLATASDLHLEQTQKAKHFSLVATVLGAGFTVALAIGGIFSDKTLSFFFNSAFPFWIVTLLAALNLLLIRYYFTETQQHRNKAKRFILKELLKIPQVKILYIAFFTFMMGWIISLQFLSTFVLEHFKESPLRTTTLFLSIAIAWTFSQIIVERFLVRIFSPLRLLYATLLLTTLGFLIASQTHTFLLFFHCILVVTICSALTWTNTLTLLASFSSNYLQGKVLGANQSVATAAMVLSPFLGGFLGNYDTRTIYIFSSALLFLSFLIILLFKNKLNEKISSKS